jgi:UPF0716 family protein affecting phage T7 exclusion
MVLLLILWPVAELFVAIEVARAIGVLEMVVLVILSWPLGMWAIRTQGTAAWRRLTVTMAERRPPGRELLRAARFTGQPYDVESTAHDIDQPRLRR